MQTVRGNPCGPATDLVPNLLQGHDFISNKTMAGDGGGRDTDAHDPGDYYRADNSSWHGTHTSGTVAAVGNNSKGVIGVAYGARVVPVRVLGRGGGYTSDIVDGITWASGGSVAGAPANANPAEVINMSLGGSGACSSTYQTAINAAVSRGTTVVVAAGNSNADTAGFTPASCNNHDPGSGRGFPFQAPERGAVATPGSVGAWPVAFAWSPAVVMVMVILLEHPAARPAR